MISNRNLVAFLAMVVVLQFGYPITYHGRWLTLIYTLGYAVMLVVGLRIVSDDPIPRMPFIVVGVAAVIGNGWYGIDQAATPYAVVMFMLTGVLQFLFLAATFRFLFSPRPGTTVGQLILLAVSAYLLMGGVFAVVANTLETVSPGSFVDGVTDRPVVWQGNLYLSYVSLSTLGYGDVLPVSPWARSLTSLEAVSGTLFLAIVIARLVGTYTAEPDSNLENK